jgi:ribosomal protein L11 methyltransferase
LTLAWLVLRVPVPRAEVAALEAALQLAGAQALAEQAVDAQELFEPDPGATPLWERVEVEALFPLSEDLQPLMRQLGDVLAPQWRAELRVDFLQEADWQARSRAHAVQACFGDRLWLLPRQVQSPAAPGQAVLRLEPGLAFGSGGHPTTALCLHWLARHAEALRGRRVLDFGCGSGVLALAALLLGAQAVTAVDHDPQALQATRDNARDNAIDPGRLTVCAAHELDSQPPFDFVVANILANPLIELAPRLQALLRGGGALALSGMLPDQVAAVRGGYPEVDFAPPEQRDGWALLSGRKRDHV